MNIDTIPHWTAAIVLVVSVAWCDRLACAVGLPVLSRTPSICAPIREEIYGFLRAVPYSWQAACLALYYSPQLRFMKDEACGDLVLCVFERKEHVRKR